MDTWRERKALAIKSNSGTPPTALESPLGLDANKEFRVFLVAQICYYEKQPLQHPPPHLCLPLPPSRCVGPGIPQPRVHSGPVDGGVQIAPTLKQALLLLRLEPERNMGLPLGDVQRGPAKQNFPGLPAGEARPVDRRGID